MLAAQLQKQWRKLEFNALVSPCAAGVSHPVLAMETGDRVLPQPRHGNRLQPNARLQARAPVQLFACVVPRDTREHSNEYRIPKERQACFCQGWVGASTASGATPLRCSRRIREVISPRSHLLQRLDGCFLLRGISPTSVVYAPLYANVAW